MFGDLVEDALTEQTYDADLAGLSYKFQGESEGMYVSVSGYNDKLPVLLRTILTEVKNFVVDPRRFEVLKEQVMSYFILPVDLWLLFLLHTSYPFMASMPRINSFLYFR